MALIVRLAFLGFLLALIEPATAQEPSYYGLRFPDAVAGFARGELIDFEKDHPGLGYAAKYNGRGWVITVYVYDAAIKTIPDSLTADVVVRQFAQARGDIYTSQSQTNGKVEDKGRFDIRGSDNQLRFICGTYLILDKGRQIDSFLCLTTWHKLFVKYRLSTLHANGSTTVARRFVSGWTKVLWP